MTSSLLHVVEQGNGTSTPLILLHGFGGDAGSWLSVQTALAGTRRVLALDLPGHGRSRAHPANDYAGMAQAVLATLDHLAITRFHLAAHSMGGAVASVLALAHQERIASLTPVCPGGFGGLVNERLMRRFASATTADELQEVVSAFFAASSLVPRHVGAHLAIERADPAVNERLGALLTAMIDGPHQVPAGKERLGELTCPVRVIWGDQDEVQSAHTIAGLPPLVGVHRFAAAGHMVHVEAAREIAQILRFQLREE